MVNICGSKCDGCVDFGKQCGGCAAIGGKVYWAHHTGSDTCPIYSCCTGKKELEHCGGCNELPCRIYFDTQDPRLNEEEQKENIRRRIAALKNR